MQGARSSRAPRQNLVRAHAVSADDPSWISLPQPTWRSTIELFLGKIASIQVHQGVLGRLFDYGSVVISGTGVHSAPFRNISDPLGLRKNFMVVAGARRAA